MNQVLGNISYRAYYVWRRNLDCYMTTWATNFLPPMLEPFQYLVSFGLGLGASVGVLHFRGQAVPYMRYLAPGTVAIAIMFWSWFETTFGSYVRMYYQRTFDAITATPLMLEDVIAGELAWGATKSVLAATIMLGVLSAIGLISLPSGLWVIPLAMVGGLFFSALGLIATSLVPTIDGFNVPVFLFIFPMFTFSGTFFPVDNLPLWARNVAAALPLTYLSRMVRGAALNRLQASDLLVGAAFVAGALVASHFAIVLMRRRLVK